MDRWKLDPIRCEVWEGMVIATQVVLQEVPIRHDHAENDLEVHAELEKHMQHFSAQGVKKMDREFVRLQLKPAYKQDRMKL